MITFPNNNRRRGARLRMDRGLYTIQEVAVAAGIPASTLSWYISEGYIPAPRFVPTRKRRYYTAMQVENILRQLDDRRTE